MKIEVISCCISDIRADAVLTGVFEDTCERAAQFCGSDKLLTELLDTLIKDKEINGKLGTTTLIHSRGEISPKRVLVVGLGKSDKLSLDRLRGMAAVSGRMLRDIYCHNIGIHLGFLPRNFRYKDSIMAVIEGFLLGQYRFNKYIQGEEKIEVEQFGIYFPEGIIFDPKLISQAISTGATIARSTNLTRDICNEPGNVLTPRKFAEVAQNIGDKHRLKVTVYDEEDIKSLGMNLLLAVNAGSVEPPRLIVIEYEGAGPGQPVYGLLGKGVTFDSGGVSLKTSSSMSHMHLDKTAGAVVIGIADALASLKARVNFIGVIPAVENMPSGSSYKPDDIIRSMSGKTVEIVNTDAEGRLILADSLTYMQRMLKIKDIIDLASLTGGARTALGSEIISVFSNEKDMAKLFKEACWHSGEACWEMPLYDNYRSYIKSHVANLKNHSDDSPSMIIGALFLSEFVENGTKWMHLDIGGKTFREEDFSYQSYGATVLGMRSLIRYYLHLACEDIGKDREM